MVDRALPCFKVLTLAGGNPIVPALAGNLMSTMRSRQHEPLPTPEPTTSEPLLTVQAGESLMLRIAAIDRQSGVAEVIARCRSRENPELESVGRWSPRMSSGQARDRYFPVSVPIPRSSPSGTWELHEVTLCDGEGNVRTSLQGRDFEEMLFRVEGREDVDHTPPRLLGIKIGTA